MTIEYQEIKKKHLVKKSILNAAYKSTETHVGSALSCAEIMEAIYFQVANINKNNCNDESRDRIILSKGHAALAQYACLMLKDIMPQKVFETYNLDGGFLPAHLDLESSDGIEVSTGMSLGHGIGLAEGFALANRLKKINARIFVIIGDGELQEGSIWEGLNSVIDLNIKEITIIIDKNNMQASAETKNITDNTKLNAVFKEMGFDVKTTNGHDVDAITQVLKVNSDRSLLIIANTIKGHGLPKQFENTIKSHYVKLTPEEFQYAINNLEDK